MRQEAIVKVQDQVQRDWKDGIKGSDHGMGRTEFQLLEHRVVTGPKCMCARFAQVKFQYEETVSRIFRRMDNLNSQVAQRKRKVLRDVWWEQRGRSALSAGGCTEVRLRGTISDSASHRRSWVDPISRH